MIIRNKEVEYKKEIGQLDGIPVYELGLIGGLHVVCCRKKGEVQFLGAGPHRALARHIAKKKEPKLVITELNKSDDLPTSAFEPILQRWEAFTTALGTIKPSRP